MTYALDLSGPRAKLERAKMHIDDLRRRIGELFPNDELFPLGRQYEREQGGITVRIEHVIEIPQEWGLIVGDAVHNLRGALDHVAWQLAAKKYGFETTDSEIIKRIQFPIIINESDWPTAFNRKHMETADFENLKEFQPFNISPIDRARGRTHVLELFAGFNGISNVDKHRKIELTKVWPMDSTFVNLLGYTDCIPFEDEHGPIQEFRLRGNTTPKAGDIVWVAPVTATGPNPDMEFQSSITGYIAVREKRNVIEALDEMADLVGRVIRKF
jgi:hypothetical protein